MRLPLRSGSRRSAGGDGGGTRGGKGTTRASGHARKLVGALEVIPRRAIGVDAVPSTLCARRYERRLSHSGALRRTRAAHLTADLNVCVYSLRSLFARSLARSATLAAPRSGSASNRPSAS